MAFNASTATVAGWLGIAPICGLPARNFVPASLQSQAATVAQRNKPPGSPADFVTYCTACLIARGIITYKNVPGDCGSPTVIQPSETTQIEQGAAAGISAMAGALPLPGIGPFVTAIVNIFGANHAKAVANEQATACKVAGIINQVFAYYDAQVAAGKISPSNAYAGMQSFLAQANEQLATIAKKCNASCVYMGILAAHSDFVQSYYPAIAPVSIFSSAPGSAIASGIPGGVLQTGEGIAISAVTPVANAIGVAPGSLALILLVLVALFAIGWAVL